MNSIPKGWEIPSIGKKLRIGVPVKSGDNYTEFLKVTYDNSANKTDTTGFCIDVFKAVVDVLPYDLPYELIPYANHEGQMAGTYDDLINQLYYGVGTLFFSHILFLLLYLDLKFVIAVTLILWPFIS
jgi:ionotropic glutamate receptor